MRTARKNQKTTKYSRQLGGAPIYMTDLDGNIVYDVLYTDSEGNVTYRLDEDGNKIPLETGEWQIVFSEPVEFRASIAMSGGEAEAVTYGLSTADYEAVAVYQSRAVPLKEGDLIWEDSEVEYQNNGEEMTIKLDDGQVVTGRFPKEKSSDYMVKKVAPSLNITRAFFKATNK